MFIGFFFVLFQLHAQFDTSFYFSFFSPLNIHTYIHVCIDVLLASVFMRFSHSFYFLYELTITVCVCMFVEFFESMYICFFFCELCTGECVYTGTTLVHKPLAIEIISSIFWFFNLLRSTTKYDRYDRQRRITYEGCTICVEIIFPLLIIFFSLSLSLQKLISLLT